MDTTSQSNISGSNTNFHRLPLAELGIVGVRKKIVSTYVCDCIDDGGSPVEICENRCWEWQLVDFEETISAWWAAGLSNCFKFDNLIVERADGSFAHQNGYVHLGRVQDVFDFMVALGNDLAVLYCEPDRDNRPLVMWQFSPYTAYPVGSNGWTKCQISAVGEHEAFDGQLTHWRLGEQR